jgi:tape measure domain-containing protein
MTTAKTISSVNVALGLDYSKFKGGVAQSKSEFYTLQKIIQESTPDVDRYNYALTLLAKAEKEHVMTAQQAERAFESLQKTYKRGAYAVTELTRAHEQYIADLKRATAIADRHDNERRMANYRAEREEVQRLVRIGKLTEQAAQSHLDAYKRTLPGYTDWAAKRDKILETRSSRIAQLEKEVMTYQELHAAKTRDLDDMRRAGMSAETYWRQVGKLNEELAKQVGIIGGKGPKADKGGSLVGALQMLGLKYMAVAQVMQMMRSGIGGVMNIEKERLAMVSLAGSVEEAEKMMSGFMELSKKAPLSINSMADMARTMMSFNMPARQAAEAVEMITKATGGNEVRSQNMALALAQVSGQGKLMGQELRQLIDAGFNPLQRISESTGVSMGVLRDKMEQGLVSFEMVQQALREHTGPGGLAENILNDVSKSPLGKIQAAISELLAEAYAFYKEHQSDFDNALRYILEAFKLAGRTLILITTVAAKFYSGVMKLVDFVARWTNSFLGIDVADKTEKVKKEVEEIEKRVSDVYEPLTKQPDKGLDAYVDAAKELTKENEKLLVASGKYTEAALKIKQIEESGIALDEGKKKGIVAMHNAHERLRQSIEDAKNEMEAIAQQQKEAQDVYRRLRPDIALDEKIKKTADQIEYLDKKFGLENLGITMEDVARVMDEASGRLEQVQKELEGIAKRQESLKSIYEMLKPEAVVEQKVKDTMEQIRMLDEEFGLENLGITMEDVARVIDEVSGKLTGVADEMKKAEEELQKIADKQKGIQDMYAKLVPEAGVENRIAEAIEQIKAIEEQFGFENLGIDLEDITRVIAEASGSAASGESTTMRLGDAVQAGSSEAIRKLYDVQVKQDPTVVLKNINQTASEQLKLWQQKLGGTLVLSPATP